MGPVPPMIARSLIVITPFVVVVSLEVYQSNMNGWIGRKLDDYAGRRHLNLKLITMSLCLTRFGKRDQIFHEVTGRQRG